LIGKQFTKINQQKRNEKLSYTWQENTEFPIVINFDSVTFDKSFIWRTDYIKILIFHTILVWGALSQRRIVSALGSPTNPSSLSSISSNLEAGKRQNLYKKNGVKQDAIFSLSEIYKDSKQMKYIRYVASLKAIDCIKKRARGK